MDKASTEIVDQHPTKHIHNWGGHPKLLAKQLEPSSTSAIAEQIQSQKSLLIARGNGRSYGDSALQHTVLSTLKLNRLLAFDPVARTISCQAGVKLYEVLEVVLRHQLFLPVVPGTSQLTIGGAVAANVHGKNQASAGNFSRCIKGFELIDANGNKHWCTPHQNPSLFAATIGGMGLTGIITAVTLQLVTIPSAYLWQTHRAFRHLTDLAEYLLQAPANWPYQVAWLDGLHKSGKGIVQTAKWAPLNDLNQEVRIQAFRAAAKPQLTVPKLPTGYLLNRLVLSTYNNWRYFRLSRQNSPQLVHYSNFFFPLDQIRHWNRLYGPVGLIQYQFVLPTHTAIEGTLAIWQAIQASSCRSYLAVLKVMGDDDSPASLLSFPMAGLSLALNFKRTAKVLALFQQLDELVIHFGGRHYLVKDAHISATTFTRTYPDVRLPQDIFQSLQSQRLSSS